MFALLLTFLVGFGLIASVTGSSSGDDDDDTQPLPDRDLESGQTRHGGPGDNTYASSDELHDISINGHGGDDCFDLIVSDSTLMGGYGADQMNVEATNATIHGGTGRDTLTVDLDGTGNTVTGGGGDDTIQGHVTGTSVLAGRGADHLDLHITNATTPDDPTGPVRIDAGGGSDDVNLAVDLTSTLAAPVVTGGAGADAINLTVNLDGVPTDFLSGRPVESTRLLTVEDFVAGRDELNVDLAFGSTPTLLHGIDLIERAGGTDVVLSFAAPGHEGGLFEGVIRLNGVTGLTAADLGLPDAREFDGEPVIATSGATTTGASGDDLILTDGALTDASIRGAAGDDTILGYADQSRIIGGDGDDTIAVGGTDLLIRGGEGDDTINMGGDGEPAPMGWAGTVQGDAGNDTIGLAWDYSVDLSRAAEGGDGDDTFVITTYVGNNGPAFGSVAPVASGGEGADVFDIFLRGGGVSTDPDGNALPASGPIMTIADFDPAEDVLTIDLTGEVGGLPLESASLVEDPAGGFTDVLLRYTIPGGGVQEGSIRLMGVTGLGAGDLTLVLPAAA